MWLNKANAKGEHEIKKKVDMHMGMSPGHISQENESQLRDRDSQQEACLVRYQTDWMEREYRQSRVWNQLQILYGFVLTTQLAPQPMECLPS